MNTQTTQSAAENNKANYSTSNLRLKSFLSDPKINNDDDDELDIPLDDEIDTFGDFDDDDDDEF
ncbi:MAG: hypothetical protein JWQ25_2731 [Daejeonella sp.]|nr:hypothetical protein [Daejeonella sp.]